MYLEASNDTLYDWNFGSTQLILKSIEDGIITNLKHGQNSLLSIDLGISLVTSQSFFRRYKGMSFKYGGDGFHTFLNGVP
jgi:hypothetical protein